jgi:hypothetical protein
MKPATAIAANMVAVAVMVMMSMARHYVSSIMPTQSPIRGTDLSVPICTSSVDADSGSHGGYD